ncbi:MAG: glutamyl-tRNA reductase [Candidatus Bipolaricaulia bacterium]
MPRVEQVLSVEVSYRKAPVELRERLSFPREQLGEKLELLLNGHKLGAEPILLAACELGECRTCPHITIAEATILSTCNRAGIYALGDCPEPLARFLAGYGGELRPEELRPYLNVYEGRAAVEHLFAVGAGLESQVLGEPQILGQVREAYELALQHKAIGPILSELFRRAIYVGKRVRRETRLGRHAPSLASVAVELACRLHSDLKCASVVVIGTGQMGDLVAQLLRKRGVQQLFLVSRTPRRVEEIRRKGGEQAVSLDQLSSVLGRADIVISATEAAGFVLTAATVAESLQTRGRPLLLIDLGMPRNIDPGVRALEGVALYDLDDLKAVVDADLKQRQQEVPKAERIIQEEAQAFMNWLRERQVAPWISLLRARAEAIRQEQLRWALPKLDPLDSRQREVIEKLTVRLTNKLLHGHTERLKLLAQRSERPVELFSELFGIRPDEIGNEKLIVGTRGSTLALAQTQQVIEHLRKSFSSIEFTTKVIKTSGDQGRLGEVGAFVKELEQALLRREIDLCVHSLKDMPTQLPEGLTIAAVPERTDPRDVLISRDGLKLMELRMGARVGTDSPRRAAQLLAVRPDIVIVPVRGNVDTRLRKLDKGQYDAIVLAAAGLTRLGLQQRITEYLSTDVMLPAPGQGALAVEIREDDERIRRIVTALDHAPTRAATAAERAFLRRLGGGCRIPIAAYARLVDNQLVIEGLVASVDGTQLFREKLIGDPMRPEEVGEKLAEHLLAQGVEAILKGLI